MDVVLGKNVRPDLSISALDEVTRLGTEHGVLVGDADELQVILALAVCNEGQVGVTLLAVLSDGECVVHVVLLQKLLRVIV